MNNEFPQPVPVYAGQKPAASKIYGIEGVSDDKERTGFLSQLDAVIAATNRYNPQSIREDREYIGSILQINGRYFYTVDQGVSGQDKITIRIRIPKGTKIVAFWHTHGAAGWDRQYFSDEDIELVKTHGKPFYLADYTGQLKVLLPGDKEVAMATKYWNGMSRKNVLITGSLVMDGDGSLVMVKTRS